MHYINRYPILYIHWIIIFIIIKREVITDKIDKQCYIQSICRTNLRIFGWLVTAVVAKYLTRTGVCAQYRQKLCEFRWACARFRVELMRKTGVHQAIVYSPRFVEVVHRDVIFPDTLDHFVIYISCVHQKRMNVR